MRINDDFTQPVIMHGSAIDWVPSPAPGVERRMLFRIGDEKARATSLVRYQPGSAFDRPRRRLLLWVAVAVLAALRVEVQIA